MFSCFLKIKRIRRETMKKFVKGMDLSTLLELERCGARYYDKGQERDILAIMKDYDVDTIRLRLWNDPKSESGEWYGAGNNDLSETIAIGKKVTEAGFGVLLNFHYSDFWADPGKQIKPKAWKDFGMEELEKALSENENARLIYTIPNFQNPAGVTMSLEKRKKLYELAKKYGVMILEDNPYGDLRVSGEDIPSIKSFDEDGIVIYSGSFSKILAPGIRVGFTVAPSPIIAKMTVGKQAVDVHTTQLMQMIVAEWMEKYDVDAHIEKIQGIYRKKLELMCDMIDSELGSAVSYVRPEGGLFIWCELPQDINALDFVKRSAENMVALVPGTAFLTDTQGQSNAVRLNFSTPADDKIVDGMKILGKVLREMRG